MGAPRRAGPQLWGALSIQKASLKKAVHICKMVFLFLIKNLEWTLSPWGESFISRGINLNTEDQTTIPKISNRSKKKNNKSKINNS